MTHVFIFGTVKRGFPLHRAGVGDAPLLGHYRTVTPYPMVIAGPWYAPMMFDELGVGLHVRGELYALDEVALGKLDALESVGQPGNLRRALRVEPVNGDETIEAVAYMKSRALAVPVHSGYLDDYQDHRFIPPWSRTKTA